MVFNRDDEQVYEHTLGTFDTDEAVPVASASKLVSALTILRVVETSSMSLSSTTGAVLGWQGSQGDITLDQLVGFTSGLRATHLCTFNRATSLEDCVDTIEASAPLAPAGTQFAYGNSHLHVAARMAEVTTGKSWQANVDDGLFEPLGIKSASHVYYTSPKDRMGTTNPLVAGGLTISTNGYLNILQLLFHRGRIGANQLISTTAMERFTQNPYAAATVASSPYTATGYDYRYGFGSWLECDGAQANCQVVSSAGAFGFTPWVDYENGYYAILAMEGADTSTAADYAVDLQQTLRPLIESALSN